MKFKAASCFSGIGAPELGGPQFDWLWHAEIEKFPSAVLANRFPDSVNLGDVTADDFLQNASRYGKLDLLVGGPPCQDFSVAGLRAGMAGDRGNLTLRFLEIAHAIRPRNLLVENVPGWLSMPDNAFGSFLAGLVGADDALIPCVKPIVGKSNAGWTWRKAGMVWQLIDGPDGIPVVIDNPEDYDPSEVEQFHVDACHVPKWPSVGMVAGPRSRVAWRVFDAQYFGVAQRRRRVFVVVDFGEGADPASVLFERQGMFGNTPPCRSEGEGIAKAVKKGVAGGDPNNRVMATLDACMDKKWGSNQWVESEQFVYATDGQANAAFADDMALTLNSTNEQPYIAGPSVLYGIDNGNGACSGNDAIGTLCADSPSGGGRPLPAIAYEVGPGKNSETDCSPTLDTRCKDGPIRNQCGVAIAFSSKDYGNDATDDLSPTLRAMNHVGSHANGGGQMAVAFAENQQGAVYEADVLQALNRGGGKPGQSYPAVRVGLDDNWQVRRLTPTECERLQGFSDNWTDVPYRGKKAADGPRYKSLGNSWAVPCGAWIIGRIAERLPECPS